MYTENLSIQSFDEELWSSLENEKKRQEEHIELIASENYTSPRVLEAQGSVLTNKYAEGYPGKRYYGGCEFVDVAEQLAIDRAKELFGADYANVQPHSGASANAAVFLALCDAGDKVLGMSLDQGGHLTHGAKVNFSGKIYESFSYGLDKSGDINYDEVQALAEEHKPKVIISGFSAFSGIIKWDRFREIADSVGAYFMVDAAHFIGLVAGKAVENPMKYADVVTATTHKALRGPRGGIILSTEEFAKGVDKNIFPGAQGGALNNQIAAKAVCFKEALSSEFQDYTKQILKNASALSDSFINEGLRVVSGGTTNHIVLVDTGSVDEELTGKDAGTLLNDMGITLNRNAIPFDKRSPFVTSGIRMGTPATTTCGMKEEELTKVGNLISEILKNRSDENKLNELKSEVSNLASQFQPYV